MLILIVKNRLDREIWNFNDVVLDSVNSTSVDWNQVRLSLLYHTRKLLFDLVTNLEYAGLFSHP